MVSIEDAASLQVTFASNLSAKDAEITQLKDAIKRSNEPKPCPTAKRAPGLVTPPQSQSQQPQQCVIAQRQFPSERFVAWNDMEARNTGWGTLAFSYLLPGMPSFNGSLSSCQVKITAPKEADATAKALYVMGRLVRCQTQYRSSFDLRPEIEEEALNGAEDNLVLLHLPQKSERYDSLMYNLNQLLHVKPKYDLKPDEVIWLQVGRGYPWR